METPLNDRQKKFAQLIVDGQTAKAAYFESFPRCRKETTAEVEGCKLLKVPKVAKYIDMLRWELEETTKSDRVASKKEVMEFLTNVIRTPAGEIDEESPLCQSFEYSDSGRRLKLPDKLKAAERLAKMLGWDKPEEVKIQVDGLQTLLDQVRRGK